MDYIRYNFISVFSLSFSLFISFAPTFAERWNSIIFLTLHFCDFLALGSWLLVGSSLLPTFYTIASYHTREPCPSHLYSVCSLRCARRRFQHFAAGRKYTFHASFALSDFLPAAEYNLEYGIPKPKYGSLTKHTHELDERTQKKK